jgi:hypothetical protein
MALGIQPTESDIILYAVDNWIKYDMDQLKHSAPDKLAKFGDSTTMVQLGASLQQDTLNTIQPNHYAIPSGAIAMAIDYYYHRGESDFRNWKIIAAEASFGTDEDLIIGENDKVIVAWQGRPDLVALDHQDRLMPLDFKTKDYPDLANLCVEYKPHPQTAGYIFALNKLSEQLGFKNRISDRCVIIVCGRMPQREPRKKGESPKPRFVQIQVDYSQSELKEWQLQTLVKATRLRHMIETGNYTMNTSMCHYQFGSHCEFLEVCRRQPEIRYQILQCDYDIVKPWNTATPEERNKKGKE